MNVLYLAVKCSFFLTCALGANSQSLQCPELVNANEAKRLEYLQRDRATADSACTIFAIRELGSAGYRPAIGAIIKQLDFAIPQPPPKPGRPIRVGPVGWIGSVYPAADALFKIGAVAVPALVEVLAGEDTPGLVRQNGIQVLFAIYREDPVEGIAVLIRESRARADYLPARRLRDIAEEFSLHCIEPKRNACLNALR